MGENQDKKAVGRNYLGGLSIIMRIKILLIATSKRRVNNNIKKSYSKQTMCTWSQSKIHVLIPLPPITSLKIRHYFQSYKW